MVINYIVGVRKINYNCEYTQYVRTVVINLFTIDNEKCVAKFQNPAMIHDVVNKCR